MSKLFKRVCILIPLLWIGMLQICAADHMIGAEITYTYLGSNTYRFIVNYYRDCNGIAANVTDITIFDGIIQKSFTPAFSSTVLDISPVAGNRCNRCKSKTCSIPYGIQKYQLIADVDLSIFSGCNMLIMWGQSATVTVSNISSLGIFAISTLNRCNGDHNSPRFQYNPQFIYTVNQLNDEYQTADPDNIHDSMAYKIIPPGSGWTNITYNTGFSYLEPISYSGKPSNYLKKPRGFHYDSISGEMYFTPTKVESSFFGYEADDYKKDAKGKYYLAGNTTRWIAIAAGNFNNTPPRISHASNNSLTNPFNYSSDTITACVGVPLNLLIKANDIDKGDTVDLSISNEVTGASVKWSNYSPAVAIASFLWTPENKDVGKQPHIFTITATDHGIPVYGFTQRRFYILVPDSFTDLKIQSVDKGCGRYEFSSTADTGRHLAFKWFADDRLISKNSTVNDTFPFNGVHAMRLEVTNKNGCMNTFYDTIKLNTLPGIKAGMGIMICKGAQANLKAGGGLSYTWYPKTGLLSDTGASVFAAPGISTMYFVTGTDGKGCKAIDSVKIGVNDFNITFNPDTTVCKGATIHLEAYTFKARKYKWVNSKGIALSDTNALIIKVINDTGYTLNVTDSFGCMKSVKGIIRIGKLPANAGPDVSVCKGDSIQLHASGGPIFKWYPGPGLAKGASVPDPYVKPDNSRIFIVQVSDNAGCKANDTVKVFVSALIPKIINPVSVCPGLAVQLQASGGSHYHWDAVPGLSDFSIPNPFAHPAATTTYSVKICDSLCGCSVTDTVRVTVFNYHPAKAGADQNICLGQQATIGSDSVIGYKYTWSSVPAGFHSSHAKTSFYPVGEAMYYLFAMEPASGCSSIDSLKINVTSLKTGFTGTLNFCQGDSGHYEALSNDKQHSYVWQTKGGHIYKSGLNFVEIVWDSAGKNYVKLTESASGWPCKDSLTDTVTVLSPPPAHITALSDICLGSTLKMSVPGTPGASYSWKFGDGGLSLINDPAHRYKSVGNFMITVLVSLGKCKSADSAAITIHPLPDITPAISHTGFREYLFQNKDSAGYSASWSTGDGIYFPYNAVKYTYKSQGSYKVSYKYHNLWGCAGTYDTTLAVDDSIKPPEQYRDSLFVELTPNTDHINIFYSIGAAKSIQMVLFDAIGRRVLLQEFPNQASGVYTLSIDLNHYHFRHGLYLLKFIADGKVSVFKLIKV